MRAHRSVWPDWALWIYHDDQVQDFKEFALLQGYEKAGLLRLINTGDAKSLTGSMLWRLRPAFSPDVDRFLCRDLDSLPQPRERKAVERWIESDKPISALHDSTSHWGTVLLGGMCGFKAHYVRQHFADWPAIERRMQESGIDFNKKGSDQHFLNSVFPESDCLNEWVDPQNGPWDKDRNYCEGWARCVGGGFTAMHVPAWYDKHYPDPKILEAEACQK